MQIIGRHTIIAALAAVACLVAAIPARADTLADIFADHSANGTIVLERLSDGMRWAHDEERAATRFIPASTFKIPHTVFALHTGAADIAEVFAWDGERRRVKSWNRDQTIGEALRNSAVPVYQQVARRIGLDRMRMLLGSAAYGNGETGGEVDMFWLRGPLRISPLEQIEFLKRLYARELPFSKQAQETTVKLLADRRGTDWILRAKTGWEIESKPAIGWYVGWLEAGGDVIFFALNMDMTMRSHRQARRLIAMDALGLVSGRALH